MRKPLGNSGDKARFASKVSDLRSWHHWETTIARDKFPLIMPSVDAGEFGRVQLVRSMNTPQLLHRLDHVLQCARIASLRWHEAFDLGATAATATSGSISSTLSAAQGSSRQTIRLGFGAAAPAAALQALTEQLLVRGCLGCADHNSSSLSYAMLADCNWVLGAFSQFTPIAVKRYASRSGFRNDGEELFSRLKGPLFSHVHGLYTSKAL